MSLLSQLWTEHDRLEWEPETWLDRIHQALQDQNEEHEAEQEPLYCAAAACTINLEGSTCSAAQVGGARIYIETEEGFAPIFDEESLMPLGSGEYEIQARPAGTHSARH